jgi:hypothetical protein
MSRDPKSYVSTDEAKRAAQLANLPNLRGLPTSTSIAPGEARALKHGARSRQSKASPEWSPAVRDAIADLEARVGAELRGEDGTLADWAVPSVEAVALQRVAALRVDRYLAAAEAKGGLKPDDVDTASKVAERYHRALEREALTLRGRLDAAGAVARFDLARLMAEEAAAGDDEGGVIDHG